MLFISLSLRMDQPSTGVSNNRQSSSCYCRFTISFLLVSINKRKYGFFMRRKNMQTLTFCWQQMCLTRTTGLNHRYVSFGQGETSTIQ